MCVDACAIIELLYDELKAERVSDAIMAAKDAFTSPIGALKTVLGLTRPDKFDGGKGKGRSLSSSSTNAGSKSAIVRPVDS